MQQKGPSKAKVETVKTLIGVAADELAPRPAQETRQVQFKLLSEDEAVQYTIKLPTTTLSGFPEELPVLFTRETNKKAAVK